MKVLAAERDGVVSGLSGRNLGGRALSVKFEFRSHAGNRILETHCREENPLSLTVGIRPFAAVAAQMDGAPLRS